MPSLISIPAARQRTVAVVVGSPPIAHTNLSVALRQNITEP